MIPNPIVVPMTVAENDPTLPLNVAERDASLTLSPTSDVRPMPDITIGEVETLPTGEDATATMTGDSLHPVLNLGLPRGATGARGPQGGQGQKGDTGTAAGFGTPSASATTLLPTDSATASVTASGPDTAKVFSFAFGVPKGAKGDPGDDYVLTAADKAEIAAIVEGQITIPTKTSDLTNDSGFINAAGAASAAPVQSVNGQTGAVSLTIPTVPSNVSAFTNDAGYLTLATLPIYSGGVQ